MNVVEGRERAVVEKAGRSAARAEGSSWGGGRSDVSSKQLNLRALSQPRPSPSKVQLSRSHDRTRARPRTGLAAHACTPPAPTPAPPPTPARARLIHTYRPPPPASCRLGRLRKHTRVRLHLQSTPLIHPCIPNGTKHCRP